MFNLQSQVNRLKQLQHSKIHGLPYKPKQHDTKVEQVDGIPFDNKAEYEYKYILRRFRNYSEGFGRRLSKRKGQYHRPGGGFAGCIIKERGLRKWTFPYKE